MCLRHLQELRKLVRKSRRKRISRERQEKYFTYFDLGFKLGVVLPLLPLKGMSLFILEQREAHLTRLLVMFEVSYGTVQSPVMMITNQNRDKAVTKKGK